MKFYAEDKSMIFNAALAALPVLLIILVLPVISWHSDRLQADGRRQLIGGISASYAAMELKYHAADLNGWQTAYALDFMRGETGAALDTGRSRKAFLESTDRFRRQLENMEATTFSPADRNRLKNAKAMFDEFMRVDEVIIAAYRGREAVAHRRATDLVMGKEIELFHAISSEVEGLASAITMQSLRDASEAEVVGQTARWLSVGSAGAALLLAILVVLAMRRWMKMSRQLMDRLEDLALTDPLTGIANRRGWSERQAVAFAHGTRHQYQMALVVIDLDHFKKFNDDNGHVAGDMLLREVAHRFKIKFRGEDVFARFGGEEFVVLMVDCDLAAATAKTDELRKEMPDEQTFSAGIACWNGQESAEALLVRADKAMYQAKKGGRNQTVAGD